MRKYLIHSANRPIITEARSAQEVPSWSPPNQPIFTLKDYQQLFGHLPTTFFNQLTFYYNKDNKESEKQETSPPIISTNPPTHNTDNLPTYNINSSIGTTIIPSPSPTTNPSITLRQLLDHLPKTPLPRLPTPKAEPREAPFPKPKQTGGIGWIYTQRPAFTPVVSYDSAKGTIYTPPIAFQPVIPKSPPTYHVVVETNPLTF